MIIEDLKSFKKPNLFSAMAIGVGCIIGSGWLFAGYKAAHVAGPIAILSWVIGAILAILIALLLAEIATIYYNETGLFARLLSITHNKDYGFIVSLSNWFATMITIPSEAEASLQYLSHAFKQFGAISFIDGHFTKVGLIFVCLLMLVYGLLNYWGIKLLSKANNLITVIKICVPTLTAFVIIFAAFHPDNFTSYHETIAPYGIDKAFSAIVTCGIFYSFYGFSMITVFAKELDNPQRNIPLALGGAVLLCLIIYLFLQIAFIGAINPTIVAQGWHNLRFDSPLAQLAMLLGINWLALVLYVDAAISPSGTAIIYVGSSARMFAGMAQDGQMPSVFKKEHAKYQISRLSIITTLAFCIGLVVFFDNWDKIMIVVSVFQLISCLAVPIAFMRLRADKPLLKRTFRLSCGKSISLITYLTVSYLLAQCGTIPLVMSLVFHIVFFIIYCLIYYKNLTKLFLAIASSWSLFLYMILTAVAGYLQEKNLLNQPKYLFSWFAIFIILYRFLIAQNSFNEKN